MGLSASLLFQMGLVVLLATIIFFLAYSLPQKIAGTALVLLIPFQPIDTRYGTANVVLAFVVFIAMLMRERDVRLPMLPQILLLLFVYLISMSFTHPSTHIEHAMYLIYFLSAVLVLWVAYDLAFRYPLSGILQVFVVLNVLVVLYCFVQLAVGLEDKLRLFGREEFAMMPVRDDRRLTGPFGSPGVTAEYFVIMTYISLHQILTTSSARYRWMLSGLVLVNLLLLVATGNRGGFLTLLGAGVLFLWMFRQHLGAGRTLRIAIAGVFLVSTAAAITVNYTTFDRLFERLLETEIEEGVPDTRSVVWPMAWEEIKKRPFFGNGPRLRLVGDEDPWAYKEHVVIMYPHNLYLFLLFTTGMTGLAAFIVFLATPLYRCWKASRKAVEDPRILTFVKTGFVVMIIIFVDQIKVEFMRYSLVDYWHFLFALLGLLVAVCDQIESVPHAAKASSSVPAQGSPVPFRRKLAK